MVNLFEYRNGHAQIVSQASEPSTRPRSRGGGCRKLPLGRALLYGQRDAPWAAEPSACASRHTYFAARNSVEQHDGESPRCMNMLKNKGARALGLACIHRTGCDDGPNVLVRCEYDVGGHGWDRRGMPLEKLSTLMQSRLYESHGRRDHRFASLCVSPLYRTSGL